jgi:hypothetical protein
MALVGLMRESMLTHQVRKEVIQQQEQVWQLTDSISVNTKKLLLALDELAEEKLSFLKKGYSGTLTQLTDRITQRQETVDALEEAIARDEKKLIALKEDLKDLKTARFQAKRKTFFSTISLVSVGMAFAGLLFPPLMMVGMSLLLGSAMIDVVDSKYNYRFTNWVARTRVAKIIDGIFKKIGHFFSIEKRKHWLLGDTSKVTQAQQHSSTATIMEAVQQRKRVKKRIPVVAKKIALRVRCNTMGNKKVVQRIRHQPKHARHSKSIKKR